MSEPGAGAVRSILVPLDGSRTSARILPWVCALAQPLGAGLHLLSVVDVDRLDLPFHYEQFALQLAEETQLSLNRMLEREQGALARVGLTVTFEVVTGRPTDAIVRAARARTTDLIALSTHGRSGLGRLTMGSTAHDLAGRTPAPLFILRPGPRARGSEVRYGRVLLPLDGSAVAEAAIPLAQGLATGLGAQLIVAQVVPTTLNYATGPLWVVIPDNLEARAVDAARSYLGDVRTGLEGAGVSAEALVVRGDPPRVLLNLVKEQQIDLVVMATHGHGGTEHLLLGSVADRIVRESARPVVLVRPAGAGGAG